MPNGSCRNSSRMLKKSFFSPARPRRAETRPFPCDVLASLRGSTYRTDSRRSEVPEELFRSPRSMLGRTAHTKCGLYLLASSLAAALLNSHFEHPEATGVAIPFSKILTIVLRDPSFSAASLAGKSRFPSAKPASCITQVSPSKTMKGLSRPPETWRISGSNREALHR